MKPSELVAVTKIRQWAREGRTKTIREAAGITCAELGESIGVTDASISRWESGQRVPTGDPALKYAEAMFELEQFLNGDNGACDDCDEEDQLAEWGAEHFGSTDNSVTDAQWDGRSSRFTDEQYRMSTAVCEGGGPPKTACSLPHHEPGGAINRNGVHAAAGRIGSASLSDAARSRAAAHLRSHYKTNLNEDPPESITASGLAQTPQDGDYAHGTFNGTHTHEHSPYGSQGGDSTHEHSHSHSNDSTHKHSHPAGIERATQWAAEVRARPWTRTPNPTEAEFYSRMRASARGLVAAACPAVPTWSVRQEPDGWHVLTAAGTAWGEGPQASYADALEVISQALSDGGQALLTETWRSDMAFEGVSTGDGRYIKPGATEFRNPPSPYMLQTETAPGHMGADLAGFVTAAGMVGTTASGTGPFLANDAGRQQVQILAAVGRYGVSIDVAEAEGEPVCEEHGENLDECDFDCEWEYHFSKIVVMGLTGTPFPAFADAYIELATSTAAVAASGTPEGLIDAEIVEDEDDPFDSPALTAAANGTRPRPPAEYFSMPPMRVGDPRLVRQQSGAWACPLTVDPPDPETGLRRFYGHVADRLTCHTGIVDRCQLVPMNSPTGYAVFNKRPMLTSEGDTVRVGPITMGVGHADTNPRVKLTVDQIQAHYDGGPGAVRMGWAHAGSDQYGPWVAGVIAPGRTEEQIEEFQMLSVSGDWREVYRGKPIELVACLAGVFSPGFPLAAAALVAAGMTAPTTAQAIPEAHAEFAEDGRCIALVAAGVVRQPFPWERQLAALTRDQEALRDTIATLEQTTAPLRPYAAAEMQAQALGFAAPTPADRAVSAALQRISGALKEAVAAQAKDSDGDNDADDVKVGHGLQTLATILAQVITDQARDATEDATE